MYAMLPESRERGYKAGRFSFNVKGGRCEACQGDGLKRIEMNFLPDVYVTCDVCRGRRYNVGNSAGEVQGQEHRRSAGIDGRRGARDLENIPQVHAKLKTLADVGLGYLHLGQSSTTLSGGEAQRIKLAKELSKRQTGQDFLPARRADDRPAFRRRTAFTGRLAAAGRSREHRCRNRTSAGCDQERRLSDRPGPRGRRGGGHIVAKGTPEEVMKNMRSYTAEALRKMVKAANAA